MFSRDDYGHGPRFPLLWVFGPFVLGALIVTAVGIVATVISSSGDCRLPDDESTRL